MTPDYASLDDTILLQHIANRNQAAFTVLYERYGSAVYGLAMQVLSSPSLAEEVSQDSFMKVWNNPQQYDPKKGRFISWLLTVTRYTAIDRIRAEKRQVTSDATPVEYTNIESKLGIPHDPLRRDGQLIQKFLTQIPPEQAILVKLGFLQGMTHAELAEKLDLPLGTVKTRVRLGLQKLRVLWQEAHSTNLLDSDKK